jgi:hypothetical protein
MTTVSHRRVVRRRARPTLDVAYEVALAGLEPELRPLVIRYVDNMREGQQIRSALCTAMTRTQGGALGRRRSDRQALSAS